MDFNILLENINYCNNSKKINEEETKMYLIFPFLKYLGYSVFSPNDTVFEYECDMHEKGNRRVDCAILQNGNPIIIIEAKPFGEQLSCHWGQIKSYFISSGAEYAILTNGLTYHIFEKSQIDSNYQNCVPKYEFILNELTDDDYLIIKKLSKINLKPMIFSSNAGNKTNESLEYCCTEEEALIKFCQITHKSNIVNLSNTEVYEKYVNFCSKNSFSTYSKIAFSQKIKKYYSISIISKRAGDKVVRIFSETRRK